MASTAQMVREHVAATSAGVFIWSEDLAARAASRGAVDVALHRLAENEPLRLVRRGLYFKGERTRFGVTRPDPVVVAMEIARRRGCGKGMGPAGVSAARALGLTTQVPAVVELAVCGRPPAPISGVRFTSRVLAKRGGLRPLEIAVLEMLRVWPRFSEKGWAEFAQVVGGLHDAALVVPCAVHAAAVGERHRHPRTLAERLIAELDPSPR